MQLTSLKQFVATIRPYSSTSILLKPAACVPMDICFIVDTSISVDQKELADMYQFIENTIRSVGEVGPNGNEIAFVDYSSNAQVTAELTKYQSKDAAIAGVYTDIPALRGATKTDLGLNLAATSVFTPGVDRTGFPNLCFLLTDGKSHTSVVQASKNLRNVCKVVSIGIGSADLTQVMEIAGNKSGMYHMVNNFQDLNSQITVIVQAACSKCTVLLCSVVVRCDRKERIYATILIKSTHLFRSIPFSPDPCTPNPCKNGGVCLTEPLDPDGYKCTCSGNFIGRHCDVPMPTTGRRTHHCITMLYLIFQKSQDDVGVDKIACLVSFKRFLK